MIRPKQIEAPNEGYVAVIVFLECSACGATNFGVTTHGFSEYPIKTAICSTCGKPSVSQLGPPLWSLLT